MKKNKQHSRYHQPEKNHNENVTSLREEKEQEGVTATSIDLSNNNIICGRCRKYKAFLGMIIDYENPQEKSDMFGVDIYKFLAFCPDCIQQIQQEQSEPTNILLFPPK